jgi:hypothetical protein
VVIKSCFDQILVAVKSYLVHLRVLSGQVLFGSGSVWEVLECPDPCAGQVSLSSGIYYNSQVL